MGEEPPAVGGSEALCVAWKCIRGDSYGVLWAEQRQEL